MSVDLRYTFQRIFSIRLGFLPSCYPSYKSSEFYLGRLLFPLPPQPSLDAPLH